MQEEIELFKMKVGPSILLLKLKEEISRELNIGIDKMSLVYKEKLLKDDACSLEEYGLNSQNEKINLQTTEPINIAKIHKKYDNTLINDQKLIDNSKNIHNENHEISQIESIKLVKNIDSDPKISKSEIKIENLDKNQENPYPKTEISESNKITEKSTVSQNKSESINSKKIEPILFKKKIDLELVLACLKRIGKNPNLTLDEKKHFLSTIAEKLNTQ